MPPHSIHPLLGTRFRDAFLFASALHETQVRKKTAAGRDTEQDVPYLSHLMSVAALAVESGATEDEAIAALLHDAFEDGPDCLARKRNLPASSSTFEMLLAEIRATVTSRFGNEVCSIVGECSEDKSVCDKRIRKQQYLNNLRVASPSARFIMLCDKIHNAESILLDLTRHGDAVWTKFSLGKDQSLAFYSEALDICRDWELQPRFAPLVRRFFCAVEALRNS